MGISARSTLMLAGSLLLAFCFPLIMTGQSSKPATINLTEKDNNKALEASFGQRIQIRLRANATTGYSWLLQGLPDCLELANFSYAAGEKSMPGSGGTQTTDLIAAKPGVADVRLDYRRIWEKPVVPAASTFSVKITVH
jgi:predicted secreted protein